MPSLTEETGLILENDGNRMRYYPIVLSERRISGLFVPELTATLIRDCSFNSPAIIDAPTLYYHLSSDVYNRTMIAELLKQVEQRYPVRIMRDRTRITERRLTVQPIGFDPYIQLNTVAHYGRILFSGDSKPSKV
jgi:hypothetical protein